MVGGSPMIFLVTNLLCHGFNCIYMVGINYAQLRGHIQAILKKINVIMTLRGRGSRAMTLKVV